MKTIHNRDHLITVALRLFASQGYTAVGVQEIVATAGVTKPTLYHYFGSKEGLLTAVLESRYPVLLERLATASAYQGDLVRSLTGLFGAWFEATAQDPDFVALVLNLSYLPGHEVIGKVMAPWQQRFADILHTLFEQARPQHGNLAGHEVLLASALTGLLNHYALSLLNGTLKPSDDLLYKTVKQYMYGIYVL